MPADPPTPTFSLEEARRWVRYEGCDTCDRDHMTAAHLAGQASARAEVIREVEALQARVKVLEDGLYRAKARAERHMKGPDAYYGIAMECEKALRALSQGGEI